MPEMIEVQIDSVRVHLMTPQRLVVLKQIGSERYLPIWVGPYEAEAITVAPPVLAAGWSLLYLLFGGGLGGAEGFHAGLPDVGRASQRNRVVVVERYQQRTERARPL